MASRRTISYIGLWALIMPWLGFTWETKTVLFSLTGLLLLFIGNKHYQNEKRKEHGHLREPVKNQNINSSSEQKIEEKKTETINTFDKPDFFEAKKIVSEYKPVPEYMNVSPAHNITDHSVDQTIRHENQTEEKPIFIEEPVSLEIKQKAVRAPRKKVEMVSKPKRTATRIPLENTFEDNYEQGQV